MYDILIAAMILNPDTDIVHLASLDTEITWTRQSSAITIQVKWYKLIIDENFIPRDSTASV